MPTESPNGFTSRHRGAIAISATVAAVVLLVLAYRVTAPEMSQRTTASGERIAEGDVLEVGALPVT